jgi:hypothetical protein
VSEQSYPPGLSADLLSIVMLIRAHGEYWDVAILVSASSCLPVQLELPGSESVPLDAVRLGDRGWATELRGAVAVTLGTERSRFLR